MSWRLRCLLLAWVLLMVLLAIELGVSFLPLDPSARPLVLIPAVLMVGVVGTIFMEVGRGPEIIRLFAAAALLWLSILLGLGSLDPMTRIVYPVQTGAPMAWRRESAAPVVHQPEGFGGAPFRSQAYDQEEGVPQSKPLRCHTRSGSPFWQECARTLACNDPA